MTRHEPDTDSAQKGTPTSNCFQYGGKAKCESECIFGQDRETVRNVCHAGDCQPASFQTMHYYSMNRTRQRATLRCWHVAC